MKTFLYATFLVLLAIVSCNRIPNEHGVESFTPTFSTYKEVVDSVIQHPKNETHYGILTPIEITSIFSRLEIKSADTVLNPVSNSDLYLSNAKAALNTGIYGVDFGYLKLFGISQKMLNYMVTIRELGGKLGIPDQYLTKPLKDIKLNMSDPDTIIKLMNNAFYDIENHLRKGGRESTAGLIILGGWVEALYIATHAVYDPANPDPEVVQKIAEQKYTLTTLLSFLKNYYDDPVVVYYTKKLKYLQRYFNTFDIYFKKTDLEIDTNKQVLRSSGSAITITTQTIGQIKDYAAKLRAEIVMP